jgi:hypothetical protein
MTAEEKLFYEVETKRLCDRPDMQPTYEEQLKVARYTAGFPGDDVEGHNALKLISLVCYLTVKARANNPEAKPYHIMSKAWGKPATQGLITWYRQGSVLCELFITPKAEFSTYGCTTAEEMLKVIGDIMSTWLPF